MHSLPDYECKVVRTCYKSCANKFWSLTPFSKVCFDYKKHKLQCNSEVSLYNSFNDNAVQENIVQYRTIIKLSPTRITF